MPLDPSIILQGVNAADVAAKTQGQLAQQQATQQQLQLQRYGVAQAKQDFEDQQNWKQALAASGGDFHKAITIAAKTGLSAKMMQSLQTGYLQQQQLDANLKKDQLANENTRREGIYSDIQDLHGVTDPGEFSKLLNQKIQSGLDRGIIKQDDIPVLSQLNPGNFDSAVQTYLTPDSLAKIQTANAKRDDAVITGKNYDLNVKKSADEHANAIVTQNQAALQDANKTLVQALNTGGPLAYKKALDGLQGERADYVRGMMPSADVLAAKSPQEAIALINRGAMTAEQQTQADQAAANAKQAASFHTQELAQGNNRLAIEAANLNLRRQEYNQAYGDPSNATDGVKQLAQGLINGQFSTTDVRRMKGGQQALQLAASTPGWTDQRYATLKSFKTGKDGQDLANLVMLDKHMGTFDKDSDAQGLRINPYSANAAKVGQDANDLSSVFGKLVKGGVLSVKEHEEYMSRLNSRLPSTRAAAVDSLKELISGRIDGMRQKFQNGTGMPLPDSMLGAASTLASSPSPAPATGPKGRPSLDSIFGGAK